MGKDVPDAIVRLDERGRLSIPREVRARLMLRKYQRFMLYVEAGKIILKVA